ncbi:MAG TPA: MotA/TolQ/ExbB proton channel family protein [Phenylobacterium sp.]|nr:MotA/TolQ/ExbB proton channel family protein [Phenylobacterium sp.]
MWKVRNWASGLGLAAIAGLASPALAETDAGSLVSPVPIADRLTLAGVYAHASIPMQFVLWGLTVAVIVAVAVWLLQAVRTRQRQSAGIAGVAAYLSAQSAAAPLFGLFGMSYALLNSFIGIANVRPAPNLTVLAPGLAEASLSLGLGLFAAAISVVGHRHLKARLHALDQAEPAAARPAAPLTHPARAIA